MAPMDIAIASIGLIIGAYRIAGLKWTGTHGSNYTARNMINDLTKLTTSNLFLGEIVFKAKTPYESGYALPDKYKSGTDLNDYYHVGIVTSTNPIQITHCTGVPGGIARDTKIGKWKYGGKLKGIDYDAECSASKDEEVVVIMQNATVIGGDLNIRANKSTTSKRLGGIPNGSRVEVITNDGTWSAIDYKGVGGFVLSKYLQFDESDGTDIIKVSKPLLKNVYDAIGEMLGIKKG